MDGPPAHDRDSIDHELADDVRVRVKSELEPGERLLWAARPFRRDESLSSWFLAWSVIAVILSVVGGVSWVHVLRDPLGQIPSHVGLGLCAGFFDVFLVIVLVTNRFLKRTEQARKANTLYALTDRRAILWSPELAAGAVKVQTVLRGAVSEVYRVEHPDGSGDVIFKGGGPGSQYGDEYWAPAGFVGVADVRWVEEQVRRTLILPPAGVSDSDRRSKQSPHRPEGETA